MQETTHDGDNNFHRLKAARFKPLYKKGEAGVEALGDNGRHIESGANGGAAHLGNGGFAANRRPRLMLTRIEAGEGNDLADIGELGHVAEFSEEFCCCQGANAGNGIK